MRTSAKLRHLALIAATLCAGASLSAAALAEDSSQSGKVHASEHFAATSHRRFDDVDYWSKVFDDPARDAWQKPDLVIDALELASGDTVADLGAGTGYFSARLSRAVGVEGRVFSVEVEASLTAHLRDRAQSEHSDNLTPVLASLDDPRLPRASIDLVLIVDTIHHIDKRREYFTKLRSALSTRGRIAVIDWKKSDKIEVGPPLAHRLAREQLLSEMLALDYTLVAEPKILPYQYFLVFQPR